MLGIEVIRCHAAGRSDEGEGLRLQHRSGARLDRGTQFTEQVDKKLLTAFAIGWAAFNGIYALAVQAQLELNDSITEVSLIEGNNYRLMQYGENKLDGTALTWEEAMTREADETSTSVYGRYASQTRVHPGEVFKIIFDLMRGIKRKDALGITKSASRAPGALLGHEA